MYVNNEIAFLDFLKNDFLDLRYSWQQQKKLVLSNSLSLPRCLKKTSKMKLLSAF